MLRRAQKTLLPSTPVPTVITPCLLALERANFIVIRVLMRAVTVKTGHVKYKSHYSTHAQSVHTSVPICKSISGLCSGRAQHEHVLQEGHSLSTICTRSIGSTQRPARPPPFFHELDEDAVQHGAQQRAMFSMMSTLTDCAQQHSRQGSRWPCRRRKLAPGYYFGS